MQIIFFEDFVTAINILINYWWLWLPALLVITTIQGYEVFLKNKYFLSRKWILLELRLSKDVQRTPKAAEQIFAGLHAVFSNGLNFKDKWKDGKFFEDHFSFEIVNIEGDLHFYIKTMAGYKNLIEAQIYAQYPDAEIAEADDYLLKLPKYLPNEQYNLWGTELALGKDDVYPIKVHPFFEEQSGMGEIKRVDPLSALFEMLNTLKPSETVIIQILVRPMGSDWVKKADEVVAKLMKRDPKAQKSNKLSKAFDLIDKAAGMATPEKPKEKIDSSLLRLTPGEQEILTSVEKKISKLGFESGIRVIYLASKDVFSKIRVPEMMAAFKQFATENLNFFKPYKPVTTKAKEYFGGLYAPFKKTIEFRKKQKIFMWAKERKFVEKPSILCTEELATIYHIPTMAVQSPGLPRIEAKKSQPPEGLPIK